MVGHPDAAQSAIARALFPVNASLRYTGIDSHEGLQSYGLYNTVVAKEEPADYEV